MSFYNRREYQSDFGMPQERSRTLSRTAADPHLPDYISKPNCFQSPEKWTPSAGSPGRSWPHDFNNLLTIITSYSELALDSVAPGRSSPQTRPSGDSFRRANRAAELTRQVARFQQAATASLAGG